MKGETKSRPDLATAVRDCVEGEIMYAIRQDGGDIAFEGMDGNTVRVRLGALCSICPAGPRMAKEFVEKLLRKRFSEDINVEARFVKPYFWQ